MDSITVLGVCTIALVTVACSGRLAVEQFPRRAWIAWVVGACITMGASAVVILAVLATTVW